MSIHEPIFQPLKFKNLEIKNKLFRSSLTNLIDAYNGSGSIDRINFDEMFAKGGVGAIISANASVDVSGRFMPRVATIERDEQIHFWKELGLKIHKYNCKYIVQLNHTGHNCILKGIENENLVNISPSGGVDFLNGFQSVAMSSEQIEYIIQQFARAARRVRDAELDGVELNACHGFLISQFLSSSLNLRKDVYGGNIRGRSKFLLNIISEIKKHAGEDFHLQVKLSARDFNNALFPWVKPGNAMADTIEICKMLESAGVDAVHLTVGGFYPHPLTPSGYLPVDEINKVYAVLINSGKHTFRNYLTFSSKVKSMFFSLLWNRIRTSQFEGANIKYAKELKQHVSIPIILSGGFQTKSLISETLAHGYCEGISMARSLIANPNLPNNFFYGNGSDLKPCTYCNKCNARAIRDPVGCYDISRFDGNRDRMIKDIMSQFVE